MNLPISLILAQEAASPPADPWWHVLVEQAFAVTILFIFLTAVVALVLNQRRRDKCLKLLHGYHATVLDTSNQALWGSLRTLPKGMEVVFDRPYTTRRGITKSSALIYEAHLNNVLAFFRYAPGLDPDEQRERRRQVRRTFRPNPFRRAKRSIRNVLNTLRDAFGKALSAIIGQLTRTGRAGVLGTQHSSVDQIGQSLLGAAGNAYEPLLERHIGRPVVLQLKSPLAGDAAAIDLPGYLADYTEKYVAVFNPDHPLREEHDLALEASAARPGLAVEVEPKRFTIKATGPELVVVRRVTTDRADADVDAVLVQGASIRFHHDGAATPRVRLATTRRVDVVAPRSLATVLFGGEGDASAPPTGGASHGEPPARASGIAPEHVVESHSDEPVE